MPLLGAASASNERTRAVVLAPRLGNGAAEPGSVQTGAIGLISPLITSDVGTASPFARCTVKDASPAGTVSAGPGTETVPEQVAGQPVGVVDPVPHRA